MKKICRCECCRCPLEADFAPDPKVSGRQAHYLNASPDRINNAIGYVEGNVRWVCVACNRFRQNMTVKAAKEQVARVAQVFREGRR